MRTEVGLPYSKLSGAGNDFIIVDSRGADFEARLMALTGTTDRKKIAKLLCRRGQSVGADGLVFIEPGEGVDFAWDFYNSDGSDAEICGNAARCVAKFCFTKGIAGREMSFRTRPGIVQAKILDDLRVEVMLPAPKLIDKGVLTIVDSGVPHAVLEELSLNDLKRLRDTAVVNRFPKKAGPRGANVTFFSPSGPKTIQAITFERGIEDFTLACGTGAIAASFVFMMQKHSTRVIDVKMPGGLLEVEAPLDQNIVFLRGSARFLSEGHALKEAFDEKL